MIDPWVSHHLISIIKEEIPSILSKIDEPYPLDQIEVQYFFGITSLEEEHPSNIRSVQPKIFVIKSGNEFIYVGYASESIFSRLSTGLAESLGKVFIKEGDLESKELDLYIFEFVLLSDYSKPETRIYYQCIQSELIYLIKAQTGNWPIMQKQINLSNENLEEDKVIAKEMFQSLT